MNSRPHAHAQHKISKLGNCKITTLRVYFIIVTRHDFIMSYRNVYEVNLWKKRIKRYAFFINSFHYIWTIDAVATVHHERKCVFKSCGVWLCPPYSSSYTSCDGLRLFFCRIVIHVMKFSFLYTRNVLCVLFKIHISRRTWKRIM